MSSSPSLYKQLGLVGAAGGSPFSGRHLLLLVLGASFLAFILFVVHPNEFRIQSFFSGGTSGCTRPGPQQHASTTTTGTGGGTQQHPPAATDEETKKEEEEDVRILIGIQTLPSKHARRNLLRTVYALQAQEDDPSLSRVVDVRFVFCNVTNPDDAVLVALEMIRYGDIMVLDCAENMDNGKTYTFFSTVARAFNTTTTKKPRYDYVMKADDDTYLRLPTLASSLRGASRTDAYYGLQMPCDTENFYPFPPFMSGMGYALSWDLVTWVATSELSRRDRVGPEDMWTGRWLNLAGKGKHRYDMAHRMYNYKGESPDTCFRHGFVPDTVAVHMLKDDARWAETLAYFNATAAAGIPATSSGSHHLPGRP
ncbi:hypothetical protein PR202_gb02037 [Eleusine coracana subsp. coracana]|uniref:Hexosyltransferase n=1 Tax=Eleusine coracana subsp. coracana TaxID=191504 RepID=A0AAV5DWQ6_ELECO|nr:hypothetical protein PR202_gb02037 [Eleusine coracana subsp. coracana]